MSQALARVAAPGAPVVRGALQLRASGERPRLDYYLYVAEADAGARRTLVAVHGISGDASEYAVLLAPLAERLGATLVAPRFAPPAWRDYQRLGREGRGERADRALDRVLTEVGMLTGTDTERPSLLGYSGGGQFAHRYAMAHPDRVAAAVVCAPGWYTFPDAEVDYPRGIRQVDALPGVGFDPDAFLSVPMLVVVGDWDVARDATLRRGSAIDRQQGRHRRERATRWVAAMRDAAHATGVTPRVELCEVRGIGHRFFESVREGHLDRIAQDFFLSRENASASGAGRDA